MADLKTKTISSLAAPTAEDLVLLASMSDSEREAIFIARLKQAANSRARAITADQFIREAKAKLAHG